MIGSRIRTGRTGCWYWRMEPLSAIKPPARENRPRVNDYAFQYRATDSPVHRMGAGWKLLLGTALCAAAIGANNPWLLAALLAVNAGYYFLARLSVAELLRDLWFFLVQMAVVIVLYLLRYGIPEGIWPGVRTSLQDFTLLSSRHNTFADHPHIPDDVQHAQNPALPAGLPGFYEPAVYSLFCPGSPRDCHGPAPARRAPGSPRAAASPRNWPDLLNCLLLPLIIRALEDR